ncbi:MAG: hypothetical protein ACOYYF_11090 [Chloroflexota bacterium]|nr:hypothetical protein [Chloroflexota bacterium]MBI5702495.1 hypothetical protein [Chloroflexota bacterium]
MIENAAHTQKPAECFVERINSIAEMCDNEYYMSALGVPFGSLERARRGRLRIMEVIAELEDMGKKASCPACHQEIKAQIQRQRHAIAEIENAWNTDFK